MTTGTFQSKPAMALKGRETVPKLWQFKEVVHLHQPLMPLAGTVNILSIHKGSIDFSTEIFKLPKLLYIISSDFNLSISAMHKRWAASL
jgi:hypothetical protein